MDHTCAIHNYKIIRKLDYGNTASVYLVEDINTEIKYALKVINIKYEERVMNEITIQSSLQNKYICPLYTHFKDTKSIYLVLEYISGGNLYELLQKHGKFNEKAAVHYVKQVIKSLKYCHAQGISHRDIKLENILLTADNQIKLADFGWALKSKLMNEKCGTLDYTAPEVINHDIYDYRIDTWAVGIIIYELLVGQAPFQHSNVEETLKRIASFDYTIPEDISATAAELIKSILVPINDRPSLDEINQHRWLQN